MASAAEQLASGLNWNAFSKATDLKKRIWFTLAALIVYRFGTHVPIPGINAVAFAQSLADSQATGVLSFFDVFTGGAFQRMAIFVLGVMPYITASIVMQIVTVMSPSMGQLKKEGEAGRHKIIQYTRYLTVILAFIQGFGAAVGLEAMSAGQGGGFVLDPGFFFRFTTAITIVGGTLFLMWLGEQITQRGIGNGVSLIIFAGIVANLPVALAGLLEMGRTGSLSAVVILLLLVMVIVVVAFVVFMERAQRKIPVQYPKRQAGQRMSSADNTHLPLKVNTAGVIPPIFASSILMLPSMLGSISGGTEGPEWIQILHATLQHGQPVFITLYVALIVFFGFFYSPIVFNPEETADNLKKNGGFIPGIRPGKSTADYLQFILTRLTTIGVVYLSIVCVLPEIMIGRFDASVSSFYFGGTSLLIVVSVTIDTVGQIHSHLIAHQYEGLIRKMNLRGKK